MKRFGLLWALLPLLAGGFVSGPLPAQTTLDEVLAAYYAANGGLAKLQSVTGLKLTGKMVNPQTGLELPVTQWYLAPNQIRSEIRYQDQLVLQVYDGQSAWWVMPFLKIGTPQAMPEERARILRQQADFADPLVNFRATGQKLEFAGSEPLGEIPAYKLRLTKSDGQVVFFWIEASSGLLLKTSTVDATGPAPVPLDIRYDDYRPVLGLTRPFKVEFSSNGQVQAQLVIDAWEINPEIGKKIFRMQPGAPGAAAAPAGTTPPPVQAGSVPPQPATEQKDKSDDDQG